MPGAQRDAIAIATDTGLDVGIAEQSGQAGGRETGRRLIGVFGELSGDHDIRDLEDHHRSGILDRDILGSRC